MIEIKEIRKQFPQYSEIGDGELILGIHRKFYPEMHVKTFVNSIGGADIAMAKLPKGAMRDYWRENVVKPMDDETSEQMQARTVGTADGAVGDAGGRLGAIARSALQGGTFGFGDEIVAGGTTALKNTFGEGTTYEAELQAERDRLQIGREQNPKSTLAAEIGGAVALPGAAVKSGASKIGNTLRAGGVSAVGGGVYGFGAGEGGAENRLKDARNTALVAGSLGAAAPVIGSQVKRLYDAASMKKAIKAAGRTAPSLDELKAMAQKIYAEADNAAPLPRGEFASSMRSALDTATRKGLDADLTPGASTAFNRAIDAATDPNSSIGFREVDILRRKAQIPAGNVANRTESALGAGLINTLDDFIDTASPKLGKEIGEARKMWTQLRKSEAVAKIVKNAELQPSGFNNGLKIGFRSLLKNEKALRGFTDAEIKAMRQIVEGTKTGNILSKVGKFGVGLGNQSNMLLSSLGMGAGAVAGGIPGAVLAPALGTLAQKGAERSTAASTRALQGLLASGGNVAAPKLSQQAQGLIEQSIIRASRGVEPISQ